MFNFKSKKSIALFLGMLISCFVMVIVFHATDGLLGDKEFSEYTQEDWSIAILPLSVIIISAISSLGFALVLLIPLIRLHPTLMDYVNNKKFSDVDPGTEFLVFDHNELKRACCREVSKDLLWISVKEYDLKTKKWIILEKGRYIENADDLNLILKEDYKYDSVKVYHNQSHNSY